jgi:hypothetical protein
MWGPSTWHIHVAVESVLEWDVAHRPGTDRFSTLYIKLHKACRGVLGTDVVGKLKRDPAVCDITTAMRKCMLVDPHVVPSSAQFNADAAVVELVGCSRKPKPCINGYDIIIAMQKWWLEKGYFLQQLDGNNCRPIACMKIMELFHGIDVEEACEI